MSRRGSIRKDASGRWFFVVDVPGHDGGRRQLRRRGFATKRAAESELDRLVGEVVTGVFVDPSKLTIERYIEDQWLPSMAATVRPTTFDTYSRLARKHVIPRLGPVALQRLDRAHVGQWVAELVATGLSPKSVRNVHGVLAKALSDAVELGLVPRNVAMRTRGLPAAERPRPKAWSPDQLRRFLAAVDEDRLAPLWRLIAMTGCRRGEALGLRWSDVDLEAGVAVIAWQRTIAGGKVVEGAPKTNAGSRAVALDPGTVRSLKAWRAQQSAERLVMGVGWPDTDLVFTHGDGSGLWPQMVTARFRAVATELGLPTIGVHGLRHSAATFLIASGVNPRVVQQRLGHAHVSVTLGLYTHVLPAHDRSAVEALAEAVDRPAVTNL